MGEIILLQSSLWLEAVTVEQKVSVTQGGEGMPTDTAGSQPHHGSSSRCWCGRSCKQFQNVNGQTKTHNSRLKGQGWGEQREKAAERAY